MICNVEKRTYTTKCNNVLMETQIFALKRMPFRYREGVSVIVIDIMRIYSYNICVYGGG